MAQIVFYKKDHLYKVNGEIYPNVSEILRFISREVYGDINQFRLDNAGERGKKVHEATEVLDKYGEVKITTSIQPYINAYIKFLEENEPQWLEIEKSYASETLKYAGTIDRIGTLNKGKYKNCLVLLDIKTNSAIKKQLAGTQLNGYHLLVNEDAKYKIDKLLILHLKNDGNYTIIDIEQDKTNFMACLTLHNLLKKKSRKVNKGEIE
jgi:hypothetical protein